VSLASDVRARIDRVPRWVVVLVMVLLSLLLLAALWPSRGDPGEPVPVTRGDLVLTVDVDGELEAVRSRELGCPAVPEVEFKIAFMAPEGTEVKEGEPVLRFDTEALERLLAQKRAEYEEARTKVEQKTIDLEMKRLALEEQIAQARAALEKAKLDTELPPVLQTRVEREKALLEMKGCERDLENLQAEIETTEALVGSELRSLVGQRDRARGRVEALETNIEKMTVGAPQDGIVVYRTSWNDEKKKVGDSVWYGEQILAIPDLAEMKGDGFVDEADGGPVEEGQPVTVRLEARPDFDLEGNVASGAPSSGAPGAPPSRASGSRSSSRRPTPRSCARPCASGARSRPRASPTSSSCPARPSSSAATVPWSGRGAASAGARSRSSSDAATRRRSRCSRVSRRVTP
jgi:HlyD family secretion protein